MKGPLLRLLRVADRPDPPPGADSSLEVFRASKRFLYYLGIDWVIKQFFGFVGIAISLLVLGGHGIPFLSGRADVAERIYNKLQEVDIEIGLLFVHLPLLKLISVVEIFAIFAFLIQLILSGVLLKLGWEMRWYMVSDKSLRIREGLVSVREQTMTIANIQNMRVRQGPLQKLFGISDLEVQTAGGGSTAPGSNESSGTNQFHIGKFRGLENAGALRDRLRRSLIRHRGAGLGDPDETDAMAPSALKIPAGGGAALEAAAQGVLNEVRSLRRTFAQRSPRSSEAPPRLADPS